MVHRSGRDPTPIFLPIESQDMGKGTSQYELFSIDEGINAGADNVWSLNMADLGGFANEDDLASVMMSKGRIIGFLIAVNQNTQNQIMTITMRKNLADTPHVITFDPAQTGNKDSKSFAPIEFVAGDRFDTRFEVPAGTGSANILETILIETDGTPS